MGSKMKKIFIVSISLMVIGLVVFAVAMTLNGWDFTTLSNAKIQTNTFNVIEEFSDISIDTDTADITFFKSEDGDCKVVCVETDKIKHTAVVKDGVLTIKVEDGRKWYEYIGFNFNKFKVTVYLTNTNYNSLKIKESTGDVSIPKDFTFDSTEISLSTGAVNYSASAKEIKINTSTGSINVDGVTAENIELSVSTGGVTLNNSHCNGDIKVKVSTGKTTISSVTCKNFNSSGSTGSITLKSVIANGKISVERSTGDIIFDGLDGLEIFAETDTGDIKGSLLSEKIFIVDTDTGRKDVPKTTSGGKCELTTDTGDIIITIK